MFSSHPSTDQPFSSPWSSSQVILAVLHARKLLLSERSLLHKKPLAQKVVAHRHLGHRCIYIQKPFRNTLYYKACTKHFPVLLCTTKLAQSTFQYYFVLQSLHKVLPSTTLYYTACTKNFPVLLCTAKLAQTISQYYFRLQSLHKPLPSPTLYYTKFAPSTTLYYRACTKHFPVLLCTTNLAQSTSQYYIVLLSLHKALPSSTLYYKTSQYYFVLQSLYKARSSPTLVHKALPSTARFWNREAFTHNKLLHREAFTHSKLSHTASVYTQNTYTQCFYTWQAFTHTQQAF